MKHINFFYFFGGVLMKIYEEAGVWLKFKNSFKELKSIKNLGVILIFVVMWIILNL